MTTTPIVGPVVLGEGHVKSESDLNEVEFAAKGATDLYVAHNKIVPGGDTGWHSHPGINFFMVRAGTATEYLGDDPDGEPNVYPAGTCLVRPAGHVHLLANEGNTDLELVAFLIVPFGAPPRINEPAP
jgi:mannose-6-phosphate isomerase-like protein (cupin superfamily)